MHYTLSPLHMNKRTSGVKPTLTTTCFFGASYTFLLTGIIYRSIWETEHKLGDQVLISWSKTHQVQELCMIHIRRYALELHTSVLIL